MKKFVLVDPTAYKQERQHDVVRPAVVESQSPLDTQILSILNDQSKPDDVKAKLYAQALTKHTPTPSLPQVDLQSEVLDSVPIGVRHKAKRILRELNDNPEVAIEPDGRFVYRQTPVENSNVVDLVVDLLRDKRIETGSEPFGWREFAQSLSKLEKYYIPNTRSWKTISVPIKKKEPPKRVIAHARRTLKRRKPSEVTFPHIPWLSFEGKTLNPPSKKSVNFWVSLDDDKKGLVTS